MENVECIVIGAGVVGLAVAANLAQKGKEVLVIEEQNAIGTQTSSRNSEVIHAGIYYPPNSLKAALCKPGRDELYTYCDERGVPYKRCGKLIVATEAEQVPDLRGILKSGHENGVSDLEFYHEEILREKAPALNAVAAIWSPSTGIIDSHQLMLALLGDLESNSGMLALNSKVTEVVATAEGFEVCVQGESQDKIFTRCLINCAGLGAVSIASNMQGLPSSNIPDVSYAKGNYFSYSGSVPFDCLVYPMPAPGGLGIHLTLDQAGQARFGPDVEWIDKASYEVNPGLAGKFATSISSYWPEVELSKLHASYSGIRLKTLTSSGEYHDFIISGPKDHGLNGLVNLFGIESPGLTSCLAIAEYVSKIVHI